MLCVSVRKCVLTVRVLQFVRAYVCVLVYKFTFDFDDLDRHGLASKGAWHKFSKVSVGMNVTCTNTKKSFMVTRSHGPTESALRSLFACKTSLVRHGTHCSNASMLMQHSHQSHWQWKLIIRCTLSWKTVKEERIFSYHTRIYLYTHIRVDVYMHAHTYTYVCVCRWAPIAAKFSTVSQCQA